jgi:tetratricopeptide (TPR) repeat protein
MPGVCTSACLAILVAAAAGARFPAAQEVNEVEAVSFGKAIVAAYKEKKFDTLDDRYDVDAMLDRTLKGVEVGESAKQGFRAGAKKSMKLSTFLRQLSGTFESLAFLRYRAEGGSPRILFRAWGERGANFLEIVLAPAGDSVRGVDIFSYLSGEPLSETCRRLFLGSLAGEPGFVGKLLKKENEYLKALPKIKEAVLLVREAKYAEALREISTLPEAMKVEKCILVLRLQAASNVGTAEATAALKDFRKAFPDDPALDFLSIDPLFMARRFDEVRESLDRLDRRLGGDAYIEFLRANSYLAEERFDLARSRAVAAIGMEKTLAGPYWTLVNISLKEKKYADTVKWLERVESDLKQEIGDLTQAEEYAGFVRSPEYEDWGKGRAKAK